jgi:hypothetical protein
VARGNVRQCGNRPGRARHDEQTGRDRGGRAQPAEPATAARVRPEPLDHRPQRRDQPAAAKPERSPPAEPDAADPGQEVPAEAATLLASDDLGADLVEAVTRWLDGVSEPQSVAERVVHVA